MDMIEIINKKKDKEELSYDELKFAFMGYLNEKIESYQMSSLLMAIVLNGMTDEETIALTDIFINSGDILDLSSIKGVKIDKHSTGGIGDKTTLIVAPIVTSLGIKVCKMSGRGLGYTGGTIDKLESIPGFNVSLTDEEMVDQVNRIGIALTGQTKNLAPLDKKVYALRDVTATVESIPLIASSIMSKKIASGADKIMIDIKLGNGALIKTRENAEHLSRIMKTIGKRYNKEVRTIITSMDTPLGKTIGNALEVIEAISILKGNGKNSYLYNVCVELASDIVAMAKNINNEDAKNLVEEAIDSQKAYAKFIEFINAQGGELNKLKISSNVKFVRSQKDGVIKSISAIKIGMLSFALGSEKEDLDDEIDYGVGVVLNKKEGDYVNRGDILCTLYLGKKEDYPDPLECFIIE